MVRTMREVTDVNILNQLNSSNAGLKEISNPGILRQLNSPSIGLREVTDPNILKQLGEPMSPPSEKLPSRSLFGDVVASTVQSIPRLGEQVGSALKYIDQPGGSDILRNAGQRLTEYPEELAKKYDIFKPSEESQAGGVGGFARRAVTGAFKELPSSVAPALAGGATGAAIGAAIPIPGATLAMGWAGASTATFGTFYAASYQQAYEDAIKQGIPEDKAKSVARRIGLIQGGLEAVTTPITLGFALGKNLVKSIFSAPIKQLGKDAAIEGAKKVITEGTESILGKTINEIITPTIKQLGKTYITTAPIEMTQEVVQDELDAMVRRQAGMEAPAFGESAKESVGPAAVMAGLMVGGGHVYNRRQIAAVKQSLEKADTKIETRKKAAQVTASMVAGESKNPVTAQLWLNKAVEDINAGRPVDVNVTLEDIIKQYEPTTIKETSDTSEKPIPQPPSTTQSTPEKPLSSTEQSKQLQKGETRNAEGLRGDEKPIQERRVEGEISGEKSSQDLERQTQGTGIGEAGKEITSERENPSLDRSPRINAIRVDKTKVTKSYAELNNIKPDELITIYRAVPKETKEGIIPGDFIAVDKEVARFYANDLLRRGKTNESKYLSIKVPADSIRLHPDHQAQGVANEFIYNPKSIQQPKGVMQVEGQGQTETRQVVPRVTIGASKPEASPAMEATSPVSYSDLKGSQEYQPTYENISVGTKLVYPNNAIYTVTEIDKTENIPAKWKYKIVGEGVTQDAYLGNIERHYKLLPIKSQSAQGTSRVGQEPPTGGVVTALPKQAKLPVKEVKPIDISASEAVAKGISKEEWIKGQGTKFFHGSRIPIRNEKGLFSLTEQLHVSEDYAHGAGGLRDRGNLDFEVYDAGDENGLYKAIPTEKGQLRYVRNDGKELTANDINNFVQGSQATSRAKNAKIHEYYLPKDSNILTLTNPTVRNNYSKDNPGVRLLSTLDSYGNQYAQAIINSAKEGVFSWSDTKLKPYQDAWKDVLIPQLEKKGYTGIRYPDDGWMTTSVFDVSKLKTSSELSFLYDEAVEVVQKEPIVGAGESLGINKKGKTKQVQFEYDKTKVDVHPKMDSSIVDAFDNIPTPDEGSVKRSKGYRNTVLVEQLTEAMPELSVSDAEMEINFAIKPLAKITGKSTEETADIYIQQIKKSTTKELKSKKNILRQSGLPRAIEENDTLLDFIQLPKEKLIDNVEIVEADIGGSPNAIADVFDINNWDIGQNKLKIHVDWQVYGGKSESEKELLILHEMGHAIYHKLRKKNIDIDKDIGIATEKSIGVEAIANGFVAYAKRKKLTDSYLLSEDGPKTEKARQYFKKIVLDYKIQQETGKGKTTEGERNEVLFQAGADKLWAYERKLYREALERGEKQEAAHIQRLERDRVSKRPMGKEQAETVSESKGGYPGLTYKDARKVGADRPVWLVFKKDGVEVAKVRSHSKDKELFSYYKGIMPEVGADTLTQEEMLLSEGTKYYQGKQGAIEFLPNGKAIIHILENANKSTFMHEMFHLYTKIMEQTPELRPQLTILEKWIGKPVAKWTTNDREKIARGGEQYLWEGNAPTSALKAVYKKFKTWLREIYKSANALDVKLSDDVRKMWDEWFSGEDITPSGETLQKQEHGILFQSDANKKDFIEKVLNIPKNWKEEKAEYNKLKDLGIIEEDISDDFKSKIRQTIQFPLTVAKKYIKFDRIYRRAEQYFRDFENYVKTLGDVVKPYIEGDNQNTINKLLIDARLNKDAAYTNEELKALDHSEEIIKEYRAVTKAMSNTLKHMSSMLARTNNDITKIYTYISNIKLGDIKLYTELEDKTNVNKALSNTNWDKPFISEELKEQGLSSEEIQAYKSVSDMMDKDSNYVPFSRYGDWLVAVRDPSGTLLDYTFHEKQGQARAKAVQEAKKYADNEGYKIITGDVRRLASEAVEGVPVNMQPLIEMLNDEFRGEEGATMKKGEGVEEKTKKKLDISTSAAYAEILKRGFAGHFIESKNIAGFEQNLSKSISDYILGISRWMASKEARFDFKKLLNGEKDENGKQIGGINPYEQAKLYSYSDRYIKYILGNSKEGSNVRLFMFRYYLGGLVRPALLNFTQPLTTTLPTSGKYIQGGLGRRFKLLIDALKTAAIPLETLKRSNPNLAIAIEQAIKDGKLSEQMLKMLRGEVYGKKLYKFDKALSFMFEFSELMNRKSAFIMMYNEAVTNGVKVNGKLQKLSQQEAVIFAEPFVTETQFEYSKLNRPEMARGWKAPLFTFRMFSGSYLSLLKSFVKEGEFRALAEALGVMVLLGGAVAFPGLKELEKAFEIAGYDPKLYVKKLVGKWGDLFLHGVLYPLGVDVSGALSPPSLIPGELQSGIVPALSSLILGVLGDIPKRVERAWSILTKQGDVYRAIETILPEALRNMAVAIRWVKEGEAKTAAYEPITEVSSADIAMKFFGIQPAILSKAYEKKHSELILNANNASEGYNWRIAKAFYNHDSAEIVDILKGIRQHNQAITEQIQKTKDYTMTKEFIIVTQAGIAGQLLKMRQPEIAKIKNMKKILRPAYREIQNINQ